MRAIPAAAAALLALAAGPAPAVAQALPAAPGPASTPPPPSAVPAAVKLGQDEVVRRTLERSSALRGARARRDQAGAQAKSLRGHLLPGVELTDEAQRWDAPFAISIAGSPPVVARDRDTNTFTAAVGQPLLGLFHLGYDVAAAGSAADASEADLRAAEAEVKEAVLTHLLRLFEARALGQIAGASEEQLGEQLQVARARLQAGVNTRADVLRLETAVANAQQQRLQAAAQEEAERAALLVAVGERPDATDVDFAEPALPDPSEAPALASALGTALARRPEVESARLSEEAAGRQATARGWDLLPEVNAEAAYIHMSGQIFQPEDAAFVGVRASWPVWDWGARWYARSAAAAQAEAAAARQSDVRDRVSVEVAGRLAATRAAASAVGVARTGIASAEEAYRVTDALVKAGSATTTDLLDAQAALTTARSNLARARYSYAMQRVSLSRALGD